MIQIDMYEVGLGSALLMQFETGNGSVRVLADAGIQHGRDPEDTWPRVVTALKGFGDKTARIDLMIGTHYDADHLEGLVPIIKDETIAIGEAWLPPVADDTPGGAIGALPGDDQLLPFKFAEPGNEALLQYLRGKALRLHSLERFRAHLRSDEKDALERFNWRAIDGFDVNDDSLLSDSSDGFFESRLVHARDRLGEDTGHADVAVNGPPDLSPRELAMLVDWDFFPFWFSGRADIRPADRSLAWIEASEAEDAINAKSLKKVVDALKGRKVAVNMCCRTIEDGTPRRFAWDADKRRFVPGVAQSSEGPEIVLLAPSKGLIAKYSRRLPIGDYGTALAFARIPVVGTTASNELSYVLKLSHEGQNILVCGDAGCVDFKPDRRRKPFFRELIAALSDLNVVQVAHHAGANAYFYHALVEAKYPEQTELSYLLISHGVDDLKRPSDAFAKFLERFRADKQKVSLLFTSRPREDKVRDFEKLIEPLRGGATPLKQADVQLVFGKDGWEVTQHHIEPLRAA